MMFRGQLWLPALLLFCVNLVYGSPLVERSRDLSKRAVSQQVYDDLVWYFQYASSAYNDSCPKPNGNTLIEEFSDAVTDTQGFIARDDNRKEIIVSLRGSMSVIDALTDVNIVLVPVVIKGVKAPAGSLAHFGFLNAWNSVANKVLSAVQSQLDSHSGYTLVSTGHSLGGALSSLAGLTLEQNFPNVSTRMFTYGQPRTFNPKGATFVDSQFGSTAFRAVHTTDGVPTLIPRELGYQHHATEYWQNPDPPSPETTKQCSGAEDPTCSDSVPSTGINAAHGVYFGIDSGTAFCS